MINYQKRKGQNKMELEELLRQLKENNAYLEKVNSESGKVLNKIKKEMDSEFPNGFSIKLNDSV